MIKLEIGNSTCRLDGLSIADSKKLADLMSYSLAGGAAYYQPGRPTKISLLSKKGVFPTGLLPICLRFFNQSKDLTITDLRIRPKKLAKALKLNLGATPYKEQLDAASAALKHSRGVIVAPTGLGKSLIVALMIEKLQVKTLVVVPSLELKRQLTESLKLGFGPTTVGGYGKTVAVENVDALDPDVVASYDCVIIDEFHHSAAKTYRQLNLKSWGNVFYRFGLTATPFRSNEDENILMESIISRVIYRVSYEEAVSKGYIAPLEAYYIRVPKTPNDLYTWREVYNQLIISNKARNESIANITKGLVDSGASTLLLVKEVEHGDILAALTGIPFAHGNNPDTVNLINQFNKAKIKGLIATTGVCGEGVDTKPAEYVVIAGLGKSKNALMQQIGRVFRNYPNKTSGKVILINDPSHKFTKRHFKEQCKIILDEYGLVPVGLDV